jgi:hypothetical protein
MRIRSILCAIVGLVFVATTHAQDALPSLVGRWQYIQPPDHEGELLDVSLANGRLRGILNGLERVGEHGLFYYVVEVSSRRVVPRFDAAIQADREDRALILSRLPSNLASRVSAGRPSNP